MRGKREASRPTYTIPPDRQRRADRACHRLARRRRVRRRRCGAPAGACAARWRPAARRGSRPSFALDRRATGSPRASVVDRTGVAALRRWPVRSAACGVLACSPRRSARPAAGAVAALMRVAASTGHELDAAPGRRRRRPGGLVEVERMLEITRLGAGVDRDGRLATPRWSGRSTRARLRRVGPRRGRADAPRDRHQRRPRQRERRASSSSASWRETGFPTRSSPARRRRS